MRPQLLVMEGFLAYRRRTEIDFTDADLFVLSGPTGSGKSSVIDGMTFALYGSIPRIGKGSVAPLVSARADRAKVEFLFTVGEESYTAVRQVERQGTGATTTEARLQRGESQEMLAGNADEVTAAVTELLGLRYEHFIKAVVLPQGAFADFLTDQPRDRQALLGALLDMGLYEKVMQLANARARMAETRAQSIGESLAKLEVATPDELYEAGRHLDSLIEAREKLPARLEESKRLTDQHSVALAAVTACGERLTRLQAIQVPSDLETLEIDRAAAAERLESAESGWAETQEAKAGIEEAMLGHRDLAQLEALRADLRLHRDLAERKAGLDIESLTGAAAEMTANRDEMRRSLDLARIEHAAHDMRRGLSEGDTCPVCRSVVAGTFGQNGDPDVSLDRLAADLHQLEERAARARDGLMQAEGQAKQIDRQAGEVEDRLKEAEGLEGVDEQIAAVRAIVASREAAEADEKSARAVVEEARLAVTGMGVRSSGMRDALLVARDEVADEKPPLPEEDAIDAWRRFASWLAGQIETRATELTDLEEAEEVAGRVMAEFDAQQRTWLEGLGIGSTASPDRDLALAEERGRAEIIAMEKTVAQAAELEQELGDESRKALIAASLGTHLRANNFEAWLLEEAMEVLIDGANRLLDELSGGSYSLMVRKSQFEVIDHRNARADQKHQITVRRRDFPGCPVPRLTMADQLAELTGMSSRLESVFLDEGFGSLDQESLDVVASVLDELVGRGRTVGIVTHVRELAERMPVRFEVTKGPKRPR